MSGLRCQVPKADVTAADSSRKIYLMQAINIEPFLNVITIRPIAAEYDDCNSNDHMHSNRNSSFHKVLMR